MKLLPESEKTLDKKFGEHVKKHGGQYIKLETRHYSGLPDRLLLLPNAQIRFVELKSKGNTTSLIQRHVIKLLLALGFKVYVLTGGEPIERMDEIINGN